MSLKLCVLASGSKGNCIYVASEETSILIDAGLSAKKVAEKLNEIGVSADDLTAICVSHEHGDHVRGVRVLQKRHDLDLYANQGTRDGMRGKKHHGLPWKLFTTGQAFMINDLHIEPFSLPHDAYDPVGFVIREGATKIGIATDAGVATNLLFEKMKDCHALVIESNHDPQKLKQSERPWQLIQRISGRQGHLSNQQACDLILSLAERNPRMEQVYLAHLSSDCNTPELALGIIKSELEKKEYGHINVDLTSQNKISPLWRSGSKSEPL